MLPTYHANLKTRAKVMRASGFAIQKFAWLWARSGERREMSALFWSETHHRRWFVWTTIFCVSVVRVAVYVHKTSCCRLITKMSAKRSKHASELVFRSVNGFCARLREYRTRYQRSSQLHHKCWFRRRTLFCVSFATVAVLVHKASCFRLISKHSRSPRRSKHAS